MGLPTATAKKLLCECGVIDPIQMPIEIIVRSKNIILKEEDIGGSDGRILIHGDMAVITINSNISFEAKKRFTIAHELGHYLLHREKTKLFNDDEISLTHWYYSNYGKEEMEANEFASELLMPSNLFSEECKGKIFDPRVIDYLAQRFQVSKTAAILKFVESGNYPVCVIYCSDKKMRWWKRSKDFRCYLKFESNQSPPTGSVASELFNSGTVYYGGNRKQDIFKSVWFDLDRDEQDKTMYEYCLHAISHNYTLSVIWED